MSDDTPKAWPDPERLDPFKPEDFTPQTIRYRIAWCSKITGHKDSGTAPMSLFDALRWCRELNDNWTDVHHWVEPIVNEESKMDDQPQIEPPGCPTPGACSCLTQRTLRVGFASFKDGTFELNLEDPETCESVCLTGDIAAKDAEFVDRFFPTCVYVKVNIT